MFRFEMQRNRVAHFTRAFVVNFVVNFVDKVDDKDDDEDRLRAPPALRLSLFRLASIVMKPPFLPHIRFVVIHIE